MKTKDYAWVEVYQDGKLLNTVYRKTGREVLRLARHFLHGQRIAGIEIGAEAVIYHGWYSFTEPVTKLNY